MYCSLDKIDLAATVEGKQVAIQTDHRTAAEIEREPELSTLFAMARVINARSHVATPNARVHYVVIGEPPDILRDAVRATGAELFTAVSLDGPFATTACRIDDDAHVTSDEAVGELADRAFRELARRAAARVGTRDLAMALRMLEDQTFADPPARADEPAYWRRVVELAALTGELLRAKSPAIGHWVQTDRALVPFGFQVATSAGGSAVMFPTNRAQRVIEDGRDQSLFKLLLAADEAMHRPPDAATGRLMPSLRDRRNVELDEIVWRSLVEEGAHELPIVVCGIDGENTFGMIRREALDRPVDDAMVDALRNLAEEEVQSERLRIGELSLLAVSGSFYAAEKLLDRDFMLDVHAALGDELVAAVPARGLLLVTPVRDHAQLARFAALVRMHHDEAGGRALSPAVMLVEAGRIAGVVRDPASERVSTRADTAPIRADTTPGTTRRPGFLRRLLGRK